LSTALTISAPAFARHTPEAIRIEDIAFLIEHC